MQAIKIMQLSSRLLAALAVAFCPGLGLVAQSAAPEPSFAAVQTQVMYRLYNPNSGEHFYTADAGERDSVAAAGWDYEGEGWTAPVSSNTPVYRLYSGTDHHYCMDIAERDALIGFGWTDEGTGWYSDDARGVPLYRQFNPNVDPAAPTNNSGSHNYTIDRDEHDFLVSVGWIDEDVGWYGVDTAKGDSSTPSTPSTPDEPSAPNIPNVPNTSDAPSSAEPPEGVVYKPGVILLDYPDVFDYDSNKHSAKIADSVQNVRVGDTVAIKPGFVNGEYTGGAIKVSSIEGNSPRTIQGTALEMKDYVESIDTTQGDTVKLVGFVPAGGAGAAPSSLGFTDNELQAAEVYEGLAFKREGLEISWGVDRETNTVSYSISSIIGDPEASISGSIDCEGSITIDIIPDVKFESLAGYKRFGLIDRSTITVSGSANLHLQKDIPVGNAITIDKAGFKIIVGIFVHVGFDGSIELEYELNRNHSAGVELNGFWPELYGNDYSTASGTPRVNTDAEIGVMAKADVFFDNDEIINAELMPSFVLSTITEQNDDLACTDIKMKIGGSFTVGTKVYPVNDWINDLGGIDGEFSISVEKELPYRFHLENGELVEECTFWANFPTTPAFVDTGQYLGDALVCPFVIHAGNTFTIGGPSDTSADRYRFINNAKGKNGSVIRISIYDDYGNLVSKYFLTPGDPYENATWVEGSNEGEYWGDGDVSFRKKIVIEVLHGSLLIRTIQAAHVPPWEMGSCEQYDSTEEAKKAIATESPITQPTSEN